MLPRRALSKKLMDSGTVTAEGKSGMVFGLTLIGGDADASAVLRDGGASGTDIYALTTDIGPKPIVIAKETFKPPIWFSTDIYCTMSGASGKGGAYAYVLYAQGERG